VPRARGSSSCPADLQWIINSDTLIFGGFLPLGGRARTRSVVRWCSSPALRSSRSLAAPSIITTTFADGPDRTRALGV
jgi:hypothetical protein